METLRKIGSFVKIEHTLFSLPLLFAGALLSPGFDLHALPLPKLGLVIAAGVGARTFALAVNRILDRQIDARNPRTAGRELPSGALTLSRARGVALSGLALYLYAARLLGSLCFLLSPLPLAVFILYPLMKRFTPFAHFGVGLGLALAPLGGYLGLSNAWPVQPAIWYLAGFTFCWVAGFDILYACLDEDFDRGAGLFSIPSRYNKETALDVSLLLHALALLLLAGLRWAAFPRQAAWIWAALAPAALLLALEQKYGYSLEMDSPFFKINAWIGAAALLWVVAGMLS